jgi:hypothetical protein
MDAQTAELIAQAPGSVSSHSSRTRISPRRCVATSSRMGAVSSVTWTFLGKGETCWRISPCTVTRVRCSRLRCGASVWSCPPQDIAAGEQLCAHWRSTPRGADSASPRTGRVCPCVRAARAHALAARV